nr:hypothetical protein [Tanacetum cinerariifolium]GEW54536.1 hypothetical protein [Tanacetum cinerariifolium]
MPREDIKKYSLLKRGDACLTSIKESIANFATSSTPLMLLMRLRLYHVDEVNDEGFEVYFQGGLRSDEKFNARNYWLSISSEEELHFSRSLASTIRHPILRVLQKMITYGFITRVAKRIGMLTDEVLNSLSASIYYRAIDSITLRDLIGPDRRLIADPIPEVPRVAILGGPCPSMQDLYDRMGNMEICQETLKRMAHRKLYHTDRYAGLFDYMIGQYNIPVQGVYAPLGYVEEQQDDED